MVKLTLVKSERNRGLRKAAGDVLKAIHFHQTQEKPALTLDIAGRTGTSAAFVTKMLKQLEGEGLITYAAYRGARLTSEGERLAIELSRHHRLLERFLTDFLRFAPEEAHKEAEILEHVISEQFEARLADFMGNPTTCPHGAPIPNADLTYPLETPSKQKH
jgi:DtxR family transcriptional regulator, Mn-dependent transcriptional regulator